MGNAIDAALWKSFSKGFRGAFAAVLMDRWGSEYDAQSYKPCWNPQMEASKNANPPRGFQQVVEMQCGEDLAKHCKPREVIVRHILHYFTKVL